MNTIDQAFIRAYQHEEATPKYPLWAGAPTPIAVSQPTSRRTAEPYAAPGSAGGSASIGTSPIPVVSDPRPKAGAEIDGHGPRQAPPTTERRPLSTFAMKAHAVEAQFKPALEVDEFRWSQACDRLLRGCRASLRGAALTLMAADEAGRSFIGVGAPAPGVGCTTILACLARMLVEAGKSVAVVDANFAAPGLARQLGLAVDVGWEDVLAGSAPLAESVIYSLADRVALLPLARGGPAAAEQLESIHASVTAGVLRYHYDMVLFDLGAIGDPLQGAAAQRTARQCRLDGVVLTSAAGNAAALQPQRLMQVAPELATICLGVVENQLRAA